MRRCTLSPSTGAFQSAAWCKQWRASRNTYMHGSPRRQTSNGYSAQQHTPEKFCAPTKPTPDEIVRQPIMELARQEGCTAESTINNPTLAQACCLSSSCKLPHVPVQARHSAACGAACIASSLEGCAVSITALTITTSCNHLMIKLPRECPCDAAAPDSSRITNTCSLAWPLAPARAPQH
jgi:hypothetical protein